MPHDFFGREALIQRLLERMPRNQMRSGTETDEDEVSRLATATRNRFLAVVGPSGSGKSSVVRAGLVPALRRGGLPGSEHWFVVDMFPGAHPLEELEQALLRVAVKPPDNLLEQLRARRARAAARGRAGAAGRRRDRAGAGDRPVRGGLHAGRGRGGARALPR